MISEINALALLELCRGDEIWSIEYCRDAGVPEPWVLEMSDVFESGFDSERSKIYETGELRNHYEGVRDLELAYQIANFLKYDTSEIRLTVLDRRRQVAAIKQLIHET
jgi:hypothetical protein